MPEIPALVSSAAKARQQVRQHEEPEGPIEAVTAFLVYVTPEGACIMDVNIDLPLTVERPPTRHEVIGACENVKADIDRQMATEQVTMNVLGNLSRMQADPQYHIMLSQARAQAEAAAAAANGQPGNPR